MAGELRLPKWLKSGAAGAAGVERTPPPPSSNKPRSASAFIEKNLSAVAAYLSMVSEPACGVATGSGLCSGLDPRVKVAGLLILAVSAGTTSYLPALGLFFALAMILSQLLGVGPGDLLKRGLPAIALTFFIALPSAFAFFSPGSELFTIGAGRVSLTITGEGLLTALTLFVRAAAMTAFTLLIFASVSRSDLFKALSGLGVPRLFVTMLYMTFRYLFVLTRLFNDSALALRARRLGPGRERRGRAGADRGWFAGRVVFLLTRSLSIADDVGMAMSSRGFSGRFRSINEYAAGGFDYLWLGFVFFVFFLSLAY